MGKVKIPLKIKIPDFSKWPARQRILALAAAGVLALVSMDRLAIGSWGKHMASLREQTRNLELDLSRQYKLLVRELPVLAEQIRYQEYLRPGAPRELQIATLLKEIRDLAQQSLVSIEEVKPLPGTEEALVLTYAFEVHSKSTLQQWVNFLYLIENSPTLFEVEKARVMRKDKTQDSLDSILLLTAVALKE
mgnify:CR=1 FL=1